MSYLHLSSEERYVISHSVIYGLSSREIGRRLNRHHTTISREIKRNRPTYADDAVYWYDAAQAYADQRKRMSHHSIRKSTPKLVHYVKCKLKNDHCVCQGIQARSKGNAKDTYGRQRQGILLFFSQAV